GAFASHPYPGGEVPPNLLDDRKKRAVDVLKYYQSNEPDKNQVWALFIFGFFSWLPWFVASSHNAQLADFADQLNRIIPTYGTGDRRITEGRIRSMPERFSFTQHAINPISDYLFSSTGDTHYAETPIMNCSLLLFFRDPHFGGSHLGVYLIALITLCRTESTERQELCMQAIARQDIRHSPVHELKSIGGTNLLELLCRDLLSTKPAIAPCVVAHFGLLISCVISDQNNPLGECQTALRPLLNLRDGPLDGNGLDDSLKLYDMVPHLEERITGISAVTSLQRILQFIAKSFDNGLSQDPGPGVEFMVAEINSRQRQMTLKQRCQSRLEELVRARAGGPKDVTQPIGTSDEAKYLPGQPMIHEIKR
ncbi:hypothetical protein FRC07_001039, partial [Ceratobasidium sp. 392]